MFTLASDLNVVNTEVDLLISSGFTRTGENGAEPCGFNARID
jgi:hypothetical protein